MGTVGAKDFANVSKERARLLKVQAELRELELAEKRGDLIPMDLVAGAWERLAGDCRSKFLVLPSRLAPQIVACNSIAEVKETLERAIHECLSELASGASLQKISKGSATAPAPKGVRVGRPGKKAVSRKQ